MSKARDGKVYKTMVNGWDCFDAKLTARRAKANQDAEVICDYGESLIRQTKQMKWFDYHKGGNQVLDEMDSLVDRLFRLFVQYVADIRPDLRQRAWRCYYRMRCILYRWGYEVVRDTVEDFEQMLVWEYKKYFGTRDPESWDR